MTADLKSLLKPLLAEIGFTNAELRKYLFPVEQITPNQAVALIHATFKPVLASTLNTVRPDSNRSASCPDDRPPIMPAFNAYLRQWHNKPNTHWGPWVKRVQHYIDGRSKFSPAQNAWLTAAMHFASLFHTLEADQREFHLLNTPVETRLLQWLDRSSPANLFAAFDGLLDAVKLQTEAHNADTDKMHALLNSLGRAALTELYSFKNSQEELAFIQQAAQRAFTEALDKLMTEAV